MSNSWHMAPAPTKEQQDHCERVSKALISEINLAHREGAGPAILLAAIGSAAADAITCLAGPEAVAPWFEAQAKLVRELQRPN